MPTRLWCSSGYNIIACNGTARHCEAAAEEAHGAALSRCGIKLHSRCAHRLVDGVKRHVMILRFARFQHLIVDLRAGALRLDGTQVIRCRLFKAPTGEIGSLRHLHIIRQRLQRDRCAERDTARSHTTSLIRKRRIIVTVVRFRRRTCAISNIIRHRIRIGCKAPLAGQRHIISRHVEFAARRNSIFIFCVVAFPAAKCPRTLERQLLIDVKLTRRVCRHARRSDRLRAEILLLSSRCGKIARCPAVLLRHLIGQRKFGVRRERPFARQRAVIADIHKIHLANNAIFIAPAGKLPFAVNRHAILLLGPGNARFICLVIRRNRIVIAVHHGSSGRQLHPCRYQFRFRWAFVRGLCPLILHRMCGGKAGVDRLYAFAAHVIAVRRIAADEIIFVAVDLLIPADEFVACISRRSHGDAFTGRSKIVLCRRVVRYGLAHVVDDIDRAAVRILPKISAHLAVFLHARGGDEALAPLPLGDERRAAGFERFLCAIIRRKGKGFACRVIFHGVDRGQHFIFLWQQPAIEAPAILYWCGLL